MRPGRQRVSGAWSTRTCQWPRGGLRSVHIQTCSSLWCALRENSELRAGGVSSSRIRAVTFMSVSPRGGVSLHDGEGCQLQRDNSLLQQNTEFGLFLPILFILYLRMGKVVLIPATAIL